MKTSDFPCQRLIVGLAASIGLTFGPAALAAVDCSLTVPGITAISDSGGGDNEVMGVFRCTRSSLADPSVVDYRVNISGTAATRRAIFNGTDSSRVMGYDLYTDSSRTQSWSATDISGSRIRSGQLVFGSQQLIAEAAFPIYMRVTSVSSRAGPYQQQLIGTAAYTVDSISTVASTPVVTTISRSDVGCQVTRPPGDIALAYDLDTKQSVSGTTTMRLACFDSGQAVKLELRRVGSLVGASHQILGLNYNVNFVNSTGGLIGAVVDNLLGLVGAVVGLVVGLVEGLLCLLGGCPNDLYEYEVIIRAAIPGGQTPDPAALVGKCTTAGCTDLHTWEVVISY